MTAKEFNTLSHESKSDMVWEWGFLVSQAKRDNSTYILFSLNNFYVEQRISEEGAENIAAISKKVFNNNKLVKFYNVDPVKIKMIDKYITADLN